MDLIEELQDLKQKEIELAEDVKYLKQKVKEKRERIKLIKEQKQLQEELDEGSLKGLAKKGFKKLWKRL